MEVLVVPFSVQITSLVLVASVHFEGYRTGGENTSLHVGEFQPTHGEANRLAFRHIFLRPPLL